MWTSLSRRMCQWHLSHFSSVGFSMKFAILALFCVPQTTGLQNISRHHRRSPSSGDVIALDKLEGYDPVEAYHQLRRHYLTSTSFNRVDRVRDYNYPSWDSSTYANSNSKQSQHQTHQNRQYQHHVRNHHHQKEHQSSYLDNDNSHSHLSNNNEQQRCFVCLPPNKGSREAKDILAMFPKEDQSKIADCAEFGQHNSRLYEFNCPPAFGGCILRIHGPNISRACSKYRLNDCKKANSVEFCYCTESLCNDVKPQPVRLLHDDDEDGVEGSGGPSDTKDLEVPSDSFHNNQYTTTMVGDSFGALANSNDDNDVTLNNSSNAPKPFSLCINTSYITFIQTLLILAKLTPFDFCFLS